MDFLKDEFVRLPAEAGGMVGRVVEDSVGGKVRVQFADGIRVFKLEYCPMTKVEEGPETAALIQGFSAKARKPGVTAKSLGELINVFKAKFPDGFEDRVYENDERGSKLTAHEQLRGQLNQEALRAMIDQRRFPDIIQHALSVVSATDLMSHFEEVALKKALAAGPSQELFSESLFAVLYGEGDPEARFAKFVSALQTLNAAKWPIATYFLFLAFPEKYLMMKPEAMKAVAQLCSINLDYAVVPNWRTYSRVMQLGEQLFKSLNEAGLKPKDMIDVQSFISVATRLDKKSARPSATQTA